ncbi:hypothetical protein [Peteryoungia ipomoeae]|uniref:EF hand n=1 Tax=Peteryoungia ipomoeae TaxID=1210932 RepID=A0A4S8P8C0_9HYPH|nr:hypothetical protein [Peteryoungia ipomoeae]THV25815.1 hypothetical protein FAA97_06445 [Peteryoungia ipomoeae]
MKIVIALSVGFYVFSLAGFSNAMVQPALENGLEISPLEARFIETYIERVMAPFRGAAGDDQILTREDVETSVRRSEAQQRSRYMIMYFSADLNGDLKVTRREWELAYRKGDGVGGKSFERWDADHDGEVIINEIYSFATSQAAAVVSSASPGLAKFMDLAAAQDGQLTAQELETAARVTFQKYDTNNNGQLEPVETKVLLDARRKSAASQMQDGTIAACNVPKAGPEEQVLVVSAYEAAALSTVTVAGQDEVTHTAELNIEAGEAPLFIAAISYQPMIWRLTGATERVSNFIAAKTDGVVGLAKDRVTFVDGRKCLRAWVDPDKKNNDKIDYLKRMVGSSQIGLAASYTISTVRLPSDASAEPDFKRLPSSTVTFSWGPLRSSDNTAIRSLKQYHRGGVVSIDPKSVVSSSPAQPYDVLPQEAGLAQLLEAGSLEQRPKLGYVIRSSMKRFPAGLHGAHGVRFVLDQGVAMPDGSPGHSRVLTMHQVQSIRDRTLRSVPTP